MNNFKNYTNDELLKLFEALKILKDWPSLKYIDIKEIEREIRRRKLKNLL